MAEVLGVVASVLSLLEYTIKSLGLISKLKYAPTAVGNLTEQIEQLEEVIKGIQNDSALNSNRDPLNTILQGCVRDISILQERLHVLTQKLDGGTIKRSWGAVVGVAKEKEFQEAARKIEVHKSTLLIYLQNQNLFVLIFSKAKP